MATLKGTGADDKKKVAIAAVLGLVVLVLAFKTIFGGTDVPPNSAPVQPASQTVGSGAAGASDRAEATVGRRQAEQPEESGFVAVASSSSSSMDPSLHPELMAENENYLYAGSGRNIFMQGSVAAESVAIEKPKGPARPSMLQASAPVGPPQPPAIDLKFFGYSARKSGMRRAFFLHGDDVFVANEGDVVSHRYKVVRIGPLSAEVEDLPYHNTQTLPLTVAPAQN